jgi:hypothetical protein
MQNPVCKSYAFKIGLVIRRNKKPLVGKNVKEVTWSVKNKPLEQSQLLSQKE